MCNNNKEEQPKEERKTHCWDCGFELTSNLDNYRRGECYQCFLYSDGHSSK